MRPTRIYMVVLAMVALGATAHAQPVVPHACAVPEDFAAPDEPLTSVAAAIAAGGPLNVLAIGSATTVGAASRTSHGLAPGTSFPYRMVAALHAALPNIAVQLTVRGGRGLTAEAMLPLLQQALHERKYQLVLWQTGTVEAVRGLRADAMQSALEDGIDAALRVGADVVLLDFQFSRFLRANADLEPYEWALQQAATIPGVVLFQRYDLMHNWVDVGQVDLERTSKPERRQAIALLNTCLGEALAHYVLNGAADR